MSLLIFREPGGEGYRTGLEVSVLDERGLWPGT